MQQPFEGDSFILHLTTGDKEPFNNFCSYKYEDLKTTRTLDVNKGWEVALHDVFVTGRVTSKVEGFTLHYRINSASDVQSTNIPTIHYQTRQDLLFILYNYFPTELYDRVQLSFDDKDKFEFVIQDETYFVLPRRMCELIGIVDSTSQNQYVRISNTKNFKQNATPVNETTSILVEADFVNPTAQNSHLIHRLGVFQ